MLGQVMHRLKLTWSADTGGTAAQTTSTFRILLIIGVVTWILLQTLPFLPLAFIDEYGKPTDGYFRANVLIRVLILAYVVFKVTLICKTRRHIRETYSIPEQQCHGCEDCCCSYWCSCCTIAQMARHTGDYETYRGDCCSETGMPSHAPSIV